MRSPLDIQQLAADVLASVDADAANQTKEASAEASTGELKTDVGRALKLAACRIREADPAGVTTEDLLTLIARTRTKQAGALGATIGGMAGSAFGPVGMLGGAYVGHSIGEALGGGGAPAQAPAAAPPIGPQQASTGLGNVSPQAAVPKMASALGLELRKMAAAIRSQGAQAEEARLTKAAQMLNAAVGLEHLKNTSTR